MNLTLPAQLLASAAPGRSGSARRRITGGTACLGLGILASDVPPRRLDARPVVHLVHVERRVPEFVEGSPNRLGYPGVPVPEGAASQ